MTTFTVFSPVAQHLPRRLMTGCFLKALRTSMLLRLPAGRAAVVAAQGIRAREVALLRRLQSLSLLPLCSRLMIFARLRVGTRRDRGPGIVAPVVIAL